jgi:putative secretion ATPase (PEP-CTERM system associated)
MYEAYYGLTGKPFQLNPDPAFYYASRGHKRAFAYLQYGLFQSEGFIVITGEVGAGKTTLVQGLLQQLDPRRVVAVQLVSTQLEADDLLRAVAGAFGLPIASMEKAQLLLQLEAFLVALATKGQRALLIVDEAQNLAPRAVEELRMLSNFQLGEHALLQSFLVGQPELRETMRSPQMQQLRQRVLASYHLGPLDRDETKAYIEHRLKHVGWAGNPSFDASAYDAVYAASHGIPRRINTLCDRLLLSGYLSTKRDFTAADVKAVVSEIRDEMGPESIESQAPAVRRGAPANGAVRTPDQHDIAAAARVRELVGASALASLEERVARLEKSVQAMLALLERLTSDVHDGPADKEAH